ncbi:myb/SANT-like DNA-binding domain-containing protein 2 [Cetorhinus maximus]
MAGFINRRSICGDISGLERRKYLAVRSYIRLIETACPTWLPLNIDSKDQIRELSGFGLYAIGYNTRWNPKIRYYLTKLSGRGSKLVESFFTPGGKGHRVIEMKVEAKKWRSVFYKYVDMTVSEMECLQLLQRVKWMPLRRCTSEDVLSRITEESGLLALGYSGLNIEVRTDVSDLDATEDWAEESGEDQAASPESDTERDSELSGVNQIQYCYIEAVTTNIREQLMKLLQCPVNIIDDQHACADIHHFIWHPSSMDQSKLYCKWYPVKSEVLKQGCIQECLESALGYRLKYKKPGTCRTR